MESRHQKMVSFAYIQSNHKSLNHFTSHQIVLPSVTKSRTDFKFSEFPGEKQDSTGPSSKRPKLDAAEVKAMSAKQYMDELIVPTLLRGLSACNKQVRSHSVHLTPKKAY